MVMAAFGLWLFSRAPVDGSYLSHVFPAIIPQSIGMGLTFVPVTLIATTNVADEDAGLASGLFNTSQQIGGALGLAILSTLAADKTDEVLGGARRAARARREQAAALLEGFDVAFLAAAVAAARRRRRPARLRPPLRRRRASTRTAAPVPGA